MSVVYTRLPVGHTHEDIDSRFGKIWTYIRQRHVYTPQQFSQHIKAAFGNRGNIFVVLVLAIFDYYSFYNEYVDHDIKMGKGDATQHQWKFQRASPSVMEKYSAEFPNSVVIQYRKMAQDQTVMLIPCDCRDGSVLVYQNHIVRSSWQPTESVESPPGMSFATRPFAENHYPSLQKFTTGSSAEFKKVHSKIGTTHFVGQHFAWVRESWAEFALLVPGTDDVEVYNEQYNVVLPLFEQLWEVGGSFDTQHRHEPTPEQDTAHNAFSDMFADRRTIMDIAVANVTID